ncbi:MAG: MaoC family dehydratase [Pseudomonadales bacterium]
MILEKEKIQDYTKIDLGHSDWLLIDQDRINTFADATLDHQFIHVDQERAKEGPFGATIAHGFLSLSLLSFFTETMGASVEGTEMGINYGFDKVRFLQPVKVGSRIRAKATLLDVQEKSAGQYLLRQEVAIEIEGEDKPALIAEWLIMLLTS